MGRKYSNMLLLIPYGLSVCKLIISLLVWGLVLSLFGLLVCLFFSSGLKMSSNNFHVKSEGFYLQIGNHLEELCLFSDTHYFIRAGFCFGFFFPGSYVLLFRTTTQN